jgi:hypothetical protein
MLHEGGQEMGKRSRFSRHSLLIASAVLTLSLLVEAANAQDRAKLATVPAIGHSAAVVSVSFLPDGARVVPGSVDRTVTLWDTATGRLLRTLDGRSPILVQGPTFPGVDLPERESFRRVAEEFITTAAAGDIAKMTRMISPDMVTRTGREAVERYLADNVLPFFEQFKETGRSTTITRTADMPGFVFYMYMVSKADQLRPFVIFVIEENGAKVVANILLDQFVEGRHCALEAGRWKCPDFQ